MKRSDWKGSVIGMVLGDGSLYKQTYNTKQQYVFKCSHALRQQGYLEHKMNIIQHIFNYPLHIRGAVHTSDGIKKFPVCSLQTRVHPRFKVLGDNLYSWNEDRKRVKRFSQYAYNFLTKEGFAYYYMDDGCLYKHKGRDKSGQMILGTYGFPLEDVLLFKEWIKKEFNVEFSVRKHYDAYYLGRGYKYTRDMLEELSIYSPDCMKYKFLL